MYLKSGVNVLYLTCHKTRYAKAISRAPSFNPVYERLKIDLLDGKLVAWQRAKGQLKSQNVRPDSNQRSPYPARVLYPLRN